MNTTKNEMVKSLMRKGLFDSKYFQQRLRYVVKSNLNENVNYMHNNDEELMNYLSDFKWWQNSTRNEIGKVIKEMGDAAVVAKAIPKHFHDDEPKLVNNIKRSFKARSEISFGTVFKSLWKKMSEDEQRSFLMKLPKGILEHLYLNKIDNMHMPSNMNRKMWKGKSKLVNEIMKNEKDYKRNLMTTYVLKQLNGGRRGVLNSYRERYPPKRDPETRYRLREVTDMPRSNFY